MKEDLKLKENTGNAVLVPFIVGGLVGAGITLLLTPKAGKEIRHDLSSAVINGKDRILSAADKGKDLYDKGKSTVTEAIDTGKTYIREKIGHSQAA